MSSSKRLQESLIDAFPTELQLAQMVRWGLRVNLAAIAGSGTLEEITFRLIAYWAEPRHKLRELIQAARQANPDHPGLMELAREEGLMLKAPPGLEKILRPQIGITSFQLLSRLQFQVCQVRRNGSALGTGFLVGPDLVMTNYHVAFPTGANRPYGGLSVLFDYKFRPGAVAVDEGTPAALADDFLVADSPVAQLDYALLRLAGPVGKQPIAELPNGVHRHWIASTGKDGTPAALVDGDPLIIIQHPKGAPLGISFGNVTSQKDNRVLHDVNTQDGSSGSPCLDAALALTALHHAHNMKEAANQAVPWRLILSDLKQKHIELLPPPQ